MRKPLAYASALAQEALGEHDKARQLFESVAQPARWISPAVYYQSLALRKLGREPEAEAQLQALLAHADRMASEPAKIDFFYPQVPSVTFEDDLEEANRNYAAFLAGLAHLGLGHHEEARQKLQETLAGDPSQILPAEIYKGL